MVKGDERAIRDVEERDADLQIMQGRTAPSDPSQSQIEQAVSVISANYCNLSF